VGAHRAHPIAAADVEVWDLEADVVVVGHGLAGGAAAIEAARSGAGVVVLERMSQGGGATALSTGLVYFGGGTPIQQACGFEDTAQDMADYVRLAAGAGADPERIALYCEHSVEHFRWFQDLGIEYAESFLDDKVTHPLTEDCLMYSGNEEAWPYRDQAKPVPRGHKPKREGEAGGYIMEVVLAATQEAGATVVNDCRMDRLVVDAGGRVVGVAGTHERAPFHVRARRGIVLTTGGFVMDREMLAKHAPRLLDCNYPVATDTDDGSGIRMGMAVGAEAVNMGEGLVLNAYYPPSSHLKGVFVDGNGRRFINEDAYLGRTGDAILARADGRAYLILDDEIHGVTQSFHKVAAVAEGFDELGRELGMPEGALAATMDEYNRAAAEGEDPLFHKHPKYLRPLVEPPFGALDCTVEGSIFGAFTLGGLSVTAHGEVLDPDDVPVPGLYAAGRCTAGLPREGRTYASGLSLGDASFFGRLAGQQAAAAPAG
jgi:succinate dehydrogenase/fumarate reductase flavoprotein subunit